MAELTTKEIAVEEWKLLASIIARLENVEYRIRGWLMALITGLAVALYSQKLELSVSSFLFVGTSLIVVFAWMDLIHRMPKRNAIKRSAEIERLLRSELKTYDGPLVTKSLSETRRCGKGDELKRMFWNTPYCQFFLLVLLLSIAHWSGIK